jgi:hypothetical protein
MERNEFFYFKEKLGSIEHNKDTATKLEARRCSQKILYNFIFGENDFFLFSFPWT